MHETEGHSHPGGIRAPGGCGNGERAFFELLTGLIAQFTDNSVYV